MITAVVTGGSGFLGRHVVRQLRERGNRVVVVARPASDVAHLASLGVDVWRYDGSAASLQALFEQVKPSVAFHLAADGQQGPDLAAVDAQVSSIVGLGVQVLAAAAPLGLPTVIAGTYSEAAGPGATPVNMYAAVKVALRDVARYVHEAYGVGIAWLRLYDNYARDDPRSKFLTQLRDADRRRATLAAGSGLDLIDLTHVDDVARAFVVAADNLATAGGATFIDADVRTGVVLTVRDLVQVVERVVGRTMHVEWGARPGVSRRASALPERACLAGWQPRVSLEDGLRDFFADD